MRLESFDAIYHRAAERKGGEGILNRMISAPLSKAEIANIADDRVLAAFTKKVFQSGFVWRVIEQKWPDFEAVFFGFNVDKVLLMPDEMLEQKSTDKRIVRNYKKVMTVRDNALMLSDIRRQHGNFGNFANTYNADNIIELWAYLKKHGARLGGNTGPYSLRALGIDTFLLSRDVEGYFRQHDLISGSATSKRSLTAINQAFVEWQKQSDWSLQSLSQLVSLSCGDNYRLGDEE